MATKPKVTLLYAPTMDETAAIIWSVWDNAKTRNKSQSISEVSDNVSQATLMERCVEVLSQDLPVSEFINFIWVVENVSRAFMDQLDRHRQAAFWEQSFRVLDLTKFADTDSYWRSAFIEADQERRAMYDQAMHIAQTAYNMLMKSGVPSEDARGVIPLHTNVRASFVISWRHFRKMIASRSCFVSQGDYWRPVIAGFILELQRHGWPPELLDLMRELPCDATGKCPIEANVRERLKDDPNPMCPVYLNIMPPRESDEADQLMCKRFGAEAYENIVSEYTEFLGGRPLIPKAIGGAT